MDNQVASSPLSPMAQIVLDTFVHTPEEPLGRMISVNPVVAKFASWYERLRNAMEYREDEVILRATIERILKRRLLLGGNAKTTAEPLIRELLWARYLRENTVSEQMIGLVEESIDVFLRLRLAILQQHKLPEGKINEWIYQLMSSDIEHLLNPNKEKEIMANFMYQILKDHVMIEEESEETKNAQVYIGVRRSFARDDLAFLRYHLCQLYFGKITRDSVDQIAQDFKSGFEEIGKQLNFPGREKIYGYVKKRTAAFLILEDVLESHRDDSATLIADKEAFEKAVTNACDDRYKSISTKVRRAIIRSVSFILFSKVLFAFIIEGSYERFIYGHVLWSSMIINIITPPLLMVIVSLFIRTPGTENSKRIFRYIQTILHEEHPSIGQTLHVKKKSDKMDGMTIVFTVLWLFAFFLSFGAVIFVLSKLQFNFISQFIFIFFLAIVSFLSYRINLTAHIYTVGDKQGLITPLVDFLFLPVVRVGRHLTQEISRFNFFLLIFDFFIETPFKVLFAFFEQWFLFLHAKRDELE